MTHYLFVHFRETTSPDGEQVYFGISRNGFTWEPINGGRPVLWAYYGEHGVRDMTIVRERKTGKFHIIATDLSTSYGMRGKYNHSWYNIGRYGSKSFGHWFSDDLVHWSDEEMLVIGDDDFGCMWAPDVLYDCKKEDYILHWSSSHVSNQYGNKAIYFCRTKDFQTFSKPQLLYRKEDSGVIDSAIYEENGKYYLFVKSERNPANIILLVSNDIEGPYKKITAFDKSMSDLEIGKYEAPTAVKLDCGDKNGIGKWCLFLDYYGVPGRGQGYVPFVATSLEDADFKRSDKSFAFPYGFKHGTILKITEEEYLRIQSWDFSEAPDMR